MPIESVNPEVVFSLRSVSPRDHSVTTTTTSVAANA